MATTTLHDIKWPRESPKEEKKQTLARASRNWAANRAPEALLLYDPHSQNKASSVPH